MSTYISLFSGCGGFDLGFSKHFESLGAYDNEVSVINTHKINFSNHTPFLHDLNDLSLPNFNQARKAKIILAGSPCQGFSTIGKRKLDDPRNHLLFTAVDVAAKIKPKVVICENVPAVKSGKHSQYWDELKNRFHDLGYKTEEFIYDFSNHGLAQIRKRIFLIAYKGRRIDRSLLELKGQAPLNLSDVLKGVASLKDHEERQGCKDGDIAIAKHIQPGQKLSNVRGGDKSIHSWNVPEVFGHVSDSEKELLEQIILLRRRHRVRSYGDADPVSEEILETYFDGKYEKDLYSLIEKGFIVQKGCGLYDIKGAFNGKYRRLCMNSPSYTVDTNFGSPRYFLHPKQDRGFSVREAARIQGFPDDFVFEGNIRQKYRMIGNAVPPVISEQLANIIKDVFFEGKVNVKG